MKFIIGLGNPGRKYALTRHNVGFMVVDEVASHLGIKFINGNGNYLIGSSKLSTVMDDRTLSEDIYLVKPTTYMNLSGIAVREVVNSYNLVLSDLLVVCDDVYLPLGRIRIRRKGSDGGHNGLASIIKEISSTEFPRLRVGVGPVPPTEDMVDFVLNEFLHNEEDIIIKTVKRAAEATISFALLGINRTMNQYNKEVK